MVGKPSHSSHDPVRYYAFAEAYLPLDPVSAWNYVVARRLKLIVYRDKLETEFWSPSDLGLRDWSDVTEHLEAAWCAARSRVGSKAPPPDTWNAVGVVTNAD